VRGIAVTTRQPLGERPDLAPVAATLPGFEAVSWGGIMAPASTPPAIIARLNAALRAAMARPEIGPALDRQGIQPQTGSPEEFAAYVAAELDKWGGVVRKMGLTPEG
jgi:tripartite-type tricarboxylate transporter receptor subunit TctC